MSLKSTVFRQVLSYIPKAKFDQIVKKHKGDSRIRTLDCWNWFGALLFGQITGHNTVRAISKVFGKYTTKLSHLGFGEIKRSTLADANANRPNKILEAVFYGVLEMAKRQAPKHAFPMAKRLKIIDSTTINLCLSLSPWARFRRSKGAVKLHTALDLAGDLPDFCVVTTGHYHDLSVGRKVPLDPGSMAIFDRATPTQTSYGNWQMGRSTLLQGSSETSSITLNVQIPLTGHRGSFVIKRLNSQDSSARFMMLHFAKSALKIQTQESD